MIPLAIIITACCGLIWFWKCFLAGPDEYDKLMDRNQDAIDNGLRRYNEAVAKRDRMFPKEFAKQMADVYREKPETTPRSEGS